MDKNASLTAKLVARARHPLNAGKRQLLETGMRNALFEGVNENLLRLGQKAKIDKGLEEVSKFVFFPKKRTVTGLGGADPVRRFGSKAFGRKSLELIADNPELLPVAAVPIPGATIGYLGAKAGLYKLLNIPTPGHMRHLRQRQKMIDIAKTVAAGTGAVGAGVVGKKALEGQQKKRKRREQARARRERRAAMYKSAAGEIQKIAVSEKWLAQKITSGMAKASPERGRKFLQNMAAQVEGSQKLLKSQTARADREVAGLRRSVRTELGKKGRKPSKLEVASVADDRSFNAPQTMKKEFLKRQLAKRQFSGSLGVDEFTKSENRRLRESMPSFGAGGTKPASSPKVRYNRSNHPKIPKSRASLLAGRAQRGLMPAKKGRKGLPGEKVLTPEQAEKLAAKKMMKSQKSTPFFKVQKYKKTHKSWRPTRSGNMGDGAKS